MVVIENDPAVLLDRLTAWRMPTVEKWFAPRLATDSK
jgi:hypothetical protein